MITLKKMSAVNPPPKKTLDDHIRKLEIKYMRALYQCNVAPKAYSKSRDSSIPPEVMMYVAKSTNESKELVKKLENELATLHELRRNRTEYTNRPTARERTGYVPPPPDKYRAEIIAQVPKNYKLQNGYDCSGVCAALSSSLLKRHAPHDILSVSDETPMKKTKDGLELPDYKYKQLLKMGPAYSVWENAHPQATVILPVPNGKTFLDIAIDAGLTLDDLKDEFTISVSTIPKSSGHAIALVNGLLADPNFPNPAELGSIDDEILLKNTARYMSSSATVALVFAFRMTIKPISVSSMFGPAVPINTNLDKPFTGFGKRQQRKPRKQYKPTRHGRVTKSEWKWLN